MRGGLRGTRLAFVALGCLAAAFAPLSVHGATIAVDCSYPNSTAAPLSVTYLSWYDTASPGMAADNIHIVNPGTATSAGCVTIGGGAGQIGRMTYRSAAFSVDPGQETWATLGPNNLNGPVLVKVYAGPPVLASQRVQFYQSFNEQWAAGASQGATTSYFNWYDKASAGMVGDNIHVINVGTTAANITVSLPGPAPQTVSGLGPGGETWFTFPQGTIGGPVTVTSDQPVLASQRVQRYQSFNEIWAEPASQAATTSYFNWFDVSSPGMSSDNIHILNPGTAAASVSVSIPCSYPANANVAPGGEAWVTFPSVGLGCPGVHPTPNQCPSACAPVPPEGPVTVSSNQPIIASQRVHFNRSFSEIWARSAAQGSTTTWFNWYDRASPGMQGDNIHILNLVPSPGYDAIVNTVTVTLPGSPPQTLQFTGIGEAWVTFANGFGGPVKITATGPFLASQRVQYYQSFSEVWSAS